MYGPFEIKNIRQAGDAELGIVDDTPVNEDVAFWLNLANEAAADSWGYPRNIRIEQLEGPHTSYPGKWEIMQRNPDYGLAQPEDRENLEWVPLYKTVRLFDTGVEAAQHAARLHQRGEI